MINLKQIEELALDVLKRQKAHYAQAVVLDGENNVNIIGLNTENYEAKVQSIEILKQFVRDRQSKLYYVVYEAFVTEGKKDGSEIKRTEALVINEFKEKQKPNVIVWHFSKTESGEIFLINRQVINANKAHYENWTHMWDVWDEKC